MLHNLSCPKECRSRSRCFAQNQNAQRAAAESSLLTKDKASAWQASSFFSVSRRLPPAHPHRAIGRRTSATPSSTTALQWTQLRKEKQISPIGKVR